MQDVAKKVVTGLRQLAADLILGGDANPDRINGYAAELADAIGYVEVSQDLLAARELSAAVLRRIRERDVAEGKSYSRIRLSPGHVALELPEAIEQVILGDQDDSDIVQDNLIAIERGRVLAGNEFAQRRVAEMMAPDRLTITINGPQGSGKTRWANWIAAQQRGFTGLSSLLLIEIRDGRRFDVLNEVFVDG